MAASLDPQTKIDRAYEHVDALDSLVQNFSQEVCRVDMQPAFWTEPIQTAGAAVIISAEATDPPSVLWGPIIGDIVHGFRSALDQLAWALSVDYQSSPPPPDPIPRDDPWRRIGFPICLNKDGWANAVTQQLWAVGPALIADLKALQPFEIDQHAPDHEPLAVLQELWNIDKHRHLHLVNVSVELHDVLFAEAFPGLPEMEFEVVSKRAPGPLVGKTEIGRAQLITRPGGILASSLPHVGMNPRLAIDVAFGQGAPAYGGSVLHTLREIGETVQAIVAAL
jgi:hypothetical protein